MKGDHSRNRGKHEQRFRVRTLREVEYVGEEFEISPGQVVDDL